MEKGIEVIFQYITFNPAVINGKQTLDNMFIVLDAEDKMGAGMTYPQEIGGQADAGAQS